jgi:hypothetical protein
MNLKHIYGLDAPTVSRGTSDPVSQLSPGVVLRFAEEDLCMRDKEKGSLCEVAAQAHR